MSINWKNVLFIAVLIIIPAIWGMDTYIKISVYALMTMLGLVAVITILCVAIFVIRKIFVNLFIKYDSEIDDGN